MRTAFFLLVFVNLVFFVWAQGYFGGQEAGREPQRVASQLNPGKMTVAPREKATAAAPPVAVCRIVDGVAGESLHKALRDAGTEAAVRAVDEKSVWWVSINALANKAAAEKKAAELKSLGITDFHVIQAEGGGFVISLGVFDAEAAAAEVLQNLTRKGVKSARLEPRGKAATRFEVRGAAEVVRRLPELLPGANLADCP